jgi:hypothetical protein
MSKTKLAIIAALFAIGATPAAQAQDYGRYGGQECWNPGAGHFERVRPGETQNDLDFRRCRPVGDEQRDRRDYRDGRSYNDGRSYSQDAARECWNPRAGHFENVREGTTQPDLDYSRCRIVGRSSDPSYGGYQGRPDGAVECWNPRAGHFENVREGTVQNDLDFSRCRRR